MGLFDAIGALFGGSPNNAQYQAQAAPIVAPTTAAQAGTAYGQAQSGLEQQQALINALQGQGGIQNQANVYNQLAGIASGQGFNPAQAMLNQATGQNIANQAALMGSQRGASANPGMMARQAAQQGANLQQQAVGQGAAMQANQALNALGQMGGISGQQIANQMGAVQGYNQAAQNEQQALLNAINQQNAQNVSMQGNINNANQAMAQANAARTGGMLGGMLGGLGTVIGGPLGSVLGGGSKATQGLAHGGKVENPKLANVPESDRFPEQQLYPSHLKDMADLYHGTKFAYGGMSMKQGGHVPGKAEVKGDSVKNDTVPAMLSPGEVVIPKSVIESDDPVKGAAEFVAKALSKNSGKSKDHKSEFKEALQRAIAGRKNK